MEESSRSRENWRSQSELLCDARSVSVCAHLRVQAVSFAEMVRVASKIVPVPGEAPLLFRERRSEQCGARSPTSWLERALPVLAAAQKQLRGSSAR